MKVSGLAILLNAGSTVSALYTIACPNNYCVIDGSANNYIACPNTFVPATDPLVLGTLDPTAAVAVDAEECFANMGGSPDFMATWDTVTGCQSYLNTAQIYASNNNLGGLFLNSSNYYVPCAATAVFYTGQYEESPDCIPAPPECRALFNPDILESRTHTHTRTETDTTHTHTHTRTDTFLTHTHTFTNDPIFTPGFGPEDAGFRGGRDDIR